MHLVDQFMKLNIAQNCSHLPPLKPYIQTSKK